MIWANLGARVFQSGRIVLAEVLPADKVATAARRVTLASGDVIHAVIAWGLSEVHEYLGPVCSLYVFLEKSGRPVDEIFSEELGDTMDQFMVEDLNNDGKFEILAASRGGATDEMYIWQIQPDGRITELQRIEGYEVHTIADRWMDGDATIYVANKADTSPKGDPCYKTENFVWSRKQQKFVS